MASSEIQELIAEVADLKRRLAMMGRHGTVHEVKGDKMRLNLGERPDGKPFLSPWTHTSTQRGGARERRFWKKGQNVAVFAIDGDLRQAVVMPYAPNDNFKAPDHANESGQDEETYQLEDLRARKTKDGWETWLEASSQQGQQGQEAGAGGSSGGQQQGGQQKGEARAKVRLHNTGGFTARIGKDKRLAAHEKGVKMKHGANVIFVDAGGCWSSKPIEVKDDSIPDDND